MTSGHVRLECANCIPRSVQHGEVSSALLSATQHTVSVNSEKKGAVLGGGMKG